MPASIPSSLLDAVFGKVTETSLVPSYEATLVNARSLGASISI